MECGQNEPCPSMHYDQNAISKHSRFSFVNLELVTNKFKLHAGGHGKTQSIRAGVKPTEMVFIN